LWLTSPAAQEQDVTDTKATFVAETELFWNDQAA